MPAVPAHCTSVWISPNMGKIKLSQHAKHDENMKTQLLRLKNEEQVHASLGGSLRPKEHCNLEQIGQAGMNDPTDISTSDTSDATIVLV